MPVQRLLLKRGSGSPSNIFYEGEPIYDNVNKTLYVGNQGASGSGYGSPIASYSSYTASSTMLVSQTTNTAASLKLFESSSNGSNYISVVSPSALSSNITLTLPGSSGSNGQFLKTSGSGNLIWGSETDPIFSASEAASITSTDTSNWDTAYGWGNHSIVGYLTEETDPIFSASDAASITSQDISNWDTAYDLGAAAEGEIYYVSVNGNDSNNGTSFNKPFLTLKHALTVASSGDTIRVAGGTFIEVFPLEVPQGVTIKGAGLRSTKIKPTSGTKTNDCFLLNGETTVEDLTIADMFHPGYAFRFAENMITTTRSPYIQRVSVLNKGTTITADDPYGFDTAHNPPVSYKSGRGVLIDGSVVQETTLEPAMLFNECTFICPNNTGLEMTNGARTEWINCFTYFCDQSIYAHSGSEGLGGSGNPKIKISGITQTTPPAAGDTLYLFDEQSDVVASGVIASYDSGTSTFFLSGIGTGTFVVGGPSEVQDVQVIAPDNSVRLIANKITLADYTQFGASMRSIGCASVFGNSGITADGVGVKLRLFGYNFGHIGSGKDFSQDETLVDQQSEVIELNGGIVAFSSVDQGGNFRVGKTFYVNEITGAVSFGSQQFNITSLANLDITDGVSNTSTITPTSVNVGNLQFSGNSLTSTSGNITINPAGSNSTTIEGNLTVNGTLSATTTTLSSISQGNTQVAITDTGSNGTISFVADGSTIQSITSTGSVITGSITASSVIKSGGTSSQFLKADGSVDSSTYLTSYTETDTLNSVTGRGATTTNGITVGSLTSTGVVTSAGYQLVNGVPTFVQSTAPTVGQLNGLTKYIWWDTSGGNLTLWIENGN